MMQGNYKIKFSQMLKNNPQHAVLTETGGGLDLKHTVVLPANIEERELHIPSHWHQKLLMQLSMVDKVYLMIEDIDKISAKEQEKFVSLLKDRRAGNFKLPDGVQIVISCSHMNQVCDSIKKLALYIES